MSFKLGFNCTKIGWKLTEKVGIDFARWGFVFPRKLWVGDVVSVECLFMIYLISKFLVAIADIGLLYGVKMKMGIKYIGQL